MHVDRISLCTYVPEEECMGFILAACFYLCIFESLSLNLSLSAKLKASEKQPLHQGRQEYIQYIYICV